VGQPVSVANLLPVASFTFSPADPLVNDEITFNASASYDPDGYITNYEWDFGDGNTVNTAKEVVQHSYHSAGDYRVNLTITDNDGATDSIHKIIHVSAKPDVTTYDYDISGTVEAWSTGDYDQKADYANINFNPDHKPFGEILIDWETKSSWAQIHRLDVYDRTADIVVKTTGWNQKGLGAFGQYKWDLSTLVTNFSHDHSIRTWVSSGTVRVPTDIRVRWNVVHPVAVPNQPPVASFSFSPADLVVNDEITFNASASYDPDGFITNYEWDFGDGNTVSTTKKVIQHTYYPAGEYSVKLTVTDNDGAIDSIQKLIQVSAKPLNCKIKITSHSSLQDRPSIVYANGNYYVAYQSHEKGYGIFIKKFDLQWNFKKKVEVVRSGSAYYDSPSLAFANNKLYVAYVSNVKGATENDYDVKVKEYDPNSFASLRGEKYLTSLQSCQDLPSLLYKDGYFYLAYQSWEKGNGDIFIKKFDSNWNQVKKVQVTSKSSYQDRPSITSANGYLYLAYFSKETGNYDIFVKRLDPNLNLDSWKEQITSESSSQSYPSIKFVNNEYVMAYASNEAGTLGIYMKRYDSDWNFMEKTKVVDDNSANERRPSMTYAQNNYWIAYVHNLVGSDDWNIFALIPSCEQN
jgi:PKD repeat protein